MKKRIIIILSILLVITLSACSSPLIQNQRLSELRSDILVGADENYSVVLVTGLREDPFEIDGTSRKDKVYFTVITVTPESYSPLAEYNFSVTIAEQSYSGKLNRHPYNQSYSAEINTLTSEREITLTVSHGEDDSEILLESVKTENYIDAEKAYSIAEKKLSESITSKEGDYEIFVRLIENPINAGGGYFWYVAFIFGDDITYAVLIEPVTMEIAAIKE